MPRRTMITGAAGAATVGDPAPRPSPSRPAEAAPPPVRPTSTHRVHESSVSVNDITLHVVQQGRGAPVLFVHGFPDTARTWRGQMAAVAAADYHAIAVDMRGYGRSSAPVDPSQYTPLQLVGDLTALLDALHLTRATVVGHDWGAYVAHHAALLRPDRFPAVFGISFPYSPRDDSSATDKILALGVPYFYVLEQQRPEADQRWADAHRSIPSSLYWASGTPAAAQRWSPFDPARSILRPAPATLPAWIDPGYLAHTISEFARTGFHGALNYYRAMQQSFALTTPWKGAAIDVPSYYAFGAVDGLVELGRPTHDTLRAAQPQLLGVLEIAGVGHWPQHEAPDVLNEALLHFLRHTNS
jgi:pimeloyl-ACP methyl ester carboxylesterase